MAYVFDRVIKVFQEIEARMAAQILTDCGNIEKLPLGVSHLKRQQRRERSLFSVIAAARHM